MRLLFSLSLLASIAPYIAKADSSYIVQGWASTEDSACRFPDFVVHYDNAPYAEVPQGASMDTVVTSDTGEPHYLHYANGWWFDQNTGIGFQARMYNPSGTFPVSLN